MSQRSLPAHTWVSFHTSCPMTCRFQNNMIKQVELWHNSMHEATLNYTSLWADAMPFCWLLLTLCFAWELLLGLQEKCFLVVPCRTIVAPCGTIAWDVPRLPDSQTVAIWCPGCPSCPPSQGGLPQSSCGSSALRSMQSVTKTPQPDFEKRILCFDERSIWNHMK
jgi:hypothetical protein